MGCFSFIVFFPIRVHLYTERIGNMLYCSHYQLKRKQVNIADPILANISYLMPNI
jgi:hypothetical protein